MREYGTRYHGSGLTGSNSAVVLIGGTRARKHLGTLSQWNPISNDSGRQTVVSIKIQGFQPSEQKDSNKPTQ